MDGELYKKLLLEKKQNLEKELSRFAEKDPKLKHDWDTKYPRIPEGSPEEAASEVEEYSANLPIEHALELQLQGVNLALEKIEKGMYGECENCSMELPKEKLQALPEAKLCQNCAEKPI